MDCVRVVVSLLVPATSSHTNKKKAKPEEPAAPARRRARPTSARDTI
jgi:hypothetical protein